MVAERLGLAIRKKKKEHNVPLPAFNAALCKPLANKYWLCEKFLEIRDWWHGWD